MSFCVSLLSCVAYFAVLLSLGQSNTPLCTNRWLKEPVAPEDLKCNYLDGSAALQLTCSVEITSEQQNMTWFYSEEQAGSGGTHISEQFISRDGSTDTVLGAILTLPNEHIRTGYYWCMLETAEDNVVVEQLKPSRVVNVTDSCFADECEVSIVVVPTEMTRRCAIGDMEEQLSIVNLQSAEVCVAIEALTPNMQSVTTMQPVTDENNNEKPGNNEQTDSPPTTTSRTDDTTFTEVEVTGTDESVGLPSLVVWVIVGAGIALLLVIIAVLLIIITIMQCSRKRVKDRSNEMPRHFDNKAYEDTEPGLNDSFSTVSDGKQPDTELDENHTYAVIPENFTISATLGSEHSPSHHKQPPAAASSSAQPNFRHSLPGQYEVIDLEPVAEPVKPVKPVEGRDTPGRRHQYDSVVNDDDDGMDYSRLQRSDSRNRKFMSNISLSGTTSNALSIAPAPQSQGNSHPQQLGESMVFDNPSYDLLDKSTPTPSQHIDIYKSDSSSGDQTLVIPNLESGMVSLTSADRNNNNNDEYFTDSSIFLVNGLAEDETRRAALLPDSRLSKSHYTSLLSSEEETNDYNVPIVSTDTEYISEKGHVYQLLEKPREDNSGGAEERRGKGRNSAVVSYSAIKTQEDDGAGTASPISDYDSRELDTSSTSNESRSEGVAYHTLIHSSSSTEASRDHTPGDYDVIDRNIRGSKSSLNFPEPVYNVIDRNISESSITPASNLPAAEYDTIDCANAASDSSPSPLMAHSTSRHSSTPSPPTNRPPSGYGIVSRSSHPQRERVNTSYEALGVASKGDSGIASSVPPPSYSSLEGVSRARKRE